MRTIKTSYKLPSEEAEKLLGTFVDDTFYDVCLKESGIVLKPDGSVLCVLLKNSISKSAGLRMYKAIRNHIGLSRNRGTSSGQKLLNYVKADGTVSNTGITEKPVYSGIIGFFDRYPRTPYCRKTAFNMDYPELFSECLPAIREASRLFEKHLPERWAIQKAMIDKTHPDFVVPGTVFTTVTLNKNFRTACHRDAGDLPDGFGVMTYYRSGKFSGGRLVFPAFGVAADFESCDTILFDPHEIHGNTELKPISKDWERITCVHYYRKNMFYCGSAEQEMELAKKHDATQGPRAMRVKPGEPGYDEGGDPCAES